MIEKAKIEDLLLNNIVPFWLRMVDDEKGGFYGRVDSENKVHKMASKSIILNTRILWTFSLLYNSYRIKAYKKIADRAYDYILRFFRDDVNGGFYWLLNSDGFPIDSKKQTYAQAFTIYAFCEYHKIARKSGALKNALELFDILEEKTFDIDYNGYIEALDRSWMPISDVRLSEKDMNAEKTMNTHLHILEAYTNLYRISKSDKIELSLKNLIKLMSTQFISEQNTYNLFFDRKWNLLNNHVSYGHDIEGSWLMCEAAEILGNEELIRNIRALAVKMVESSLKGMDKDFGFMNEGNYKTVIDTNKDWWPQAEALVGLTNAWQITNNPKYLKIAAGVLNFIEKNLVDHEGEWFWGVSRDGLLKQNEDKAGPWKCPYHNSRAMLELLVRLPN